MTDRSHQTLAAADGRTLCFAEWGDPDGFPVFLLHGTPGGRLNRYPDESKYADAGARVITYDRPGYGSSARHAGRAVVDCVLDVATIADSLGVDGFAVSGGSGGGPHALAVAARLGHRVVRARCAVGIAPYATPGLDFFDGMDPLNIKEFNIALEGEAAAHAHITQEIADMAARVAVDPAKLLGDDWELDEADRAVMAREDIAQTTRDATADLARGGPWGWVDDDLAFTKHWGFELDEIKVPVEVRYGVKDVLVPAAHGAWLAAHVPGAIEAVEHDQGHLGDPDKVTERMHWLVTGEG